MRVAIMQPYFIPYTGYFRLFSATDLVVIYDCVQFIRRGFIHRNQLTDFQNKLQWFTLPLEKAPQTTLITNLSFQEDAQNSIQEQMRRFQVFQLENFKQNPLESLFTQTQQSPLQYITRFMQEICTQLKLPFNVISSSSLKISPEIKAKDRIIEIAKQCRATEYINLAGGKDLYHTADFQQHGIKLKFLNSYIGNYCSIFERLVTESAEAIRQDILAQSTMTE